MKLQKEELHHLFSFTVFSAIFFVLGLVIVISLPETSRIYMGLSQSFYEIKPFYSANKGFFDTTLTISIFYSEIKYLIFIFMSSLCMQKKLLLIAINSYKGFITGVGCSLFVRIISVDTNTTFIAFLLSIIYIILSVSTVLINSKYSVSSIMFSKKIITPVRIKTLLKRKDTYNQLSELLVLGGILFIITLIKIGTLLYAV